MPVSPADRRRSPRRQRGFTLVELMIVMFIIAVLVGLTVTIVPKVLRSAHTAQTSAQMSAIATAIQAYYGDFRAYPGPLPNNQVGISYYPTANYTTAPQSNYVYVLDPNAAVANTAMPLQIGTGTGSAETFAAFPSDSVSGKSTLQQITGAENLVLGLVGGLELAYTNGSVGSPMKAFGFNIANIFPDGHTPAPLGPMSLNPNSPKRLGAYIQVKTGDLSNAVTSDGMGNLTAGNFVDSGGRKATDSPIPEFLDKFSNPMPILFLRANVGGKAIAAVGGGLTKNSPTQLQDSNTAPVIAQYDLAQVLGYTESPGMGVPAIGTIIGDPTRDHHGLQGLGTADLSDPLMKDPSGMAQLGWANAGKNALAYLKDPNNPGTSNTPDYTKSPAAVGNARQKDAFILISAGPDGIYGTADDIVYPGGTVSGQQ